MNQLCSCFHVIKLFLMICQCAQLSAATLSLKINLNNNKSMKWEGSGHKKSSPVCWKSSLENLYLVKNNLCQLIFPRFAPRQELAPFS
jgi:hypothetical protein